ncbi:MAG: hypothetical protein ACKVT2_21545 [Saprospiraceae bacterium]
MGTISRQKNRRLKRGFTPQYADWEKYYTENKDNVVVLGFPSNDFMSQEPGSAEDIAAFCQMPYVCNKLLNFYLVSL